MTTLELAQEFIAAQRYKLVSVDSEEGHIAFRYQMNTIHLWQGNEDDHFIFMTMSGFADTAEEDIDSIKEKCHQINRQVKLVKMYLLDEIVLVAAEVYYLAKEDFEYQMKNALKHLISAKITYRKLGE